MPQQNRVGILPVLTMLAVFITLAFPKCGWLMGAFPVSVSYLLLGVVVVLVLFQFLINRIELLSPVAWLYAMLILLFGFYVTVVMLVNGFQQAGLSIATWLACSIVPLIAIFSVSFLTLYAPALLLKAIRWAFVIVVLLGLVNFISMNFFHQVIGIPYLTYTGDNAALLFMKDNNRGFVTKAMSTYANGNIFGVNALLWLPLVYLAIASSKLKEMLARVVFILTFSRTIWASWLLLEAVLFAKRKKINIFVLLGFIVVLVVILALLMMSKHSFLFNSNLGGRAWQLAYFTDLSWFPHHPFVPFVEVVYASVIHDLGLFGLLFFVVLYGSLLLIKAETRLGKVCKLTIFIYLFSMTVDGAFLFIPTQFVFWMVATMLLYEKRLEPVIMRRVYENSGR